MSDSLDSIDLLIVQCEKHGQVGPLGTVIKCGRCATSEAEEIERLRDELTAVLLERDQWKGFTEQWRQNSKDAVEHMKSLQGQLTAALLERNALQALLESQKGATTGG